MQALQVLTEEHQTLAAILHAIDFMIREIKAQRLQPDMKLFHAMVHYLDAYPEQRHHPKEERILFSRLRARTKEGADALDRLAQEHDASAARIRTLEEALAQYERNPDDISVFAEAFDLYAAFYWKHMLTEEREILPLLRRHFTAQDWEEVNAAFQEEEDPLQHCARDDFQMIFSRLVAAAPPPIGLGAGGFQD